MPSQNRNNDEYSEELVPSERKMSSDVRREGTVNTKGKAVGSLLLGFGIGIGLAVLFAPQSGEETREWLSASAEDQFYRIRRKGRRIVFETQDLLDRGEQQVSKVMRTGGNVLDSVASKLE